MMTPEEIKAKFNAHAEDIRQEWKKSGTVDSLNKLSEIIDNLQNCGLDISIEISGSPCERAFDLFNPVRQVGVPVSGYIKIGATQYLFGLARRINNEPVNKLALSQWAVSPQSKNSSFRTQHYNLNKKSDVNNFETYLIEQAAREKALIENDSRHVFNLVPEQKKQLRPVPQSPKRIK